MSAYKVYSLAAERRFKGLLRGFEDILLSNWESIEDAVNACMENVADSLEGYAHDWSETVDDCDEMPTKGSILGFAQFHQMVADASKDKHVPTPELDAFEARVEAHRERLRSLSSQVIEAAED